MGTEIPQRCFIRYRLANAPCTPPRRRPHPCSRNLLWRGAGTWRNRASVRCRGGKLLRLVLRASAAHRSQSLRRDCAEGRGGSRREDRKSTRLNSSHGYISYAVFCLKKKTESHSNSYSLGKTTKGHRRARAARRASIFRAHTFLASVSHYGIGLGLGLGGRSHTSRPQGGSGGVGIRNSLPWVEAEPPDMQAPVKVARLG